MINKRDLLFVSIVALFLFAFAIIYFSDALSRYEKSEVRKGSFSSPTVEQQILRRVRPYGGPETSDDHRRDDVDAFIDSLKSVDASLGSRELWLRANSWVTGRQLYDLTSGDLGSVVDRLKTARIERADVDSRGTQLKLLLTLDGSQKAVFKPKWYPKTRIIDGPVYAGKDRYGSEIAAFYLSAILRIPLAPVAVERRVSIAADILPVATRALRDTVSKNATCLYGKCFYCRRDEPVCHDPDSGTLAGAVIFNVDRRMRSARSPWQRTYKKGKRAAWEANKNYCANVKSKLSKPLLLSLIDTAVFDFLLQNGDRHHYETAAEADTVLLIDNGKGLGNPHVDHLDILAPLYQCCMLRARTWTRLNELSGGYLRAKMERMPDLRNFVADDHLVAMERRLAIVRAAVEYCNDRQGREIAED